MCKSWVNLRPWTFTHKLLLLPYSGRTERKEGMWLIPDLFKQNWPYFPRRSIYVAKNSLLPVIVKLHKEFGSWSVPTEIWLCKLRQYCTSTNYIRYVDWSKKILFFLFHRNISFCLLLLSTFSWTRRDDQ